MSAKNLNSGANRIEICLNAEMKLKQTLDYFFGTNSKLLIVIGTKVYHDDDFQVLYNYVREDDF